ncbi:MAG: cobalt-precorrin-6A reductase [Nocardioides sp.]|nr:cobalt-precorrin-6A reductase [Nocardioides sp.]
MILLLGGTAEARSLAERLEAAGANFTSSLAGRVAQPRLPVGETRIGGFGGVEGLRAHIRENKVTAVIDATHPFAEGMSANALAACRADGVPLLRLERPGWGDAPDAAGWHWVDDHAGAAATVARLGQRPFLTVGRQPIGEFTGPLADRACLVRVVDPPDQQFPEAWSLLLSRGPYALDSELALMREHGADVLVTKDSGGTWTWPKMAAAAELGVSVVVVRRPRAPRHLEITGDVDAAADWAVRGWAAGR